MMQRRRHRRRPRTAAAQPRPGPVRRRTRARRTRLHEPGQHGGAVPRARRCRLLLARRHRLLHGSRPRLVAALHGCAPCRRRRRTGPLRRGFRPGCRRPAPPAPVADQRDRCIVGRRPGCDPPWRAGRRPSRAGVVDLAVGTGESQRLVPAAAALAEAAWLAGRDGAADEALDVAWAAASAHPSPWEVGEIAYWRSVAGLPIELSAPSSEPFALMLDERSRDAADAWAARDCPMWQALALAADPSLEAARQAVDIVDRLGAPAVRAPSCGPGTHRGCPSPVAPAWPAAPTRVPSPRGNWTCSGVWPKGCRTPTSRRACSCRNEPSGHTCRRYFANSGSRRAPGSSPRRPGRA